jgi:hypothetical protein
METGIAIIILNRIIFTAGAPVAVIEATPNPAVAGQAIQSSGGGSFHQDGSKTIDSWAWDLDGNAGFDNAFGATPDVTAFFGARGAGSYLIALRVTDNTAASFPSSGMGNLSDTDTAVVCVRAATDPACASCVTNLVARPKLSKADLTWTWRAGAHHYNVYRGTISGDPYIKIGAVYAPGLPNTGVYMDSGALTLNMTYYWIVREAAASNNEVCQSNQAAATMRARQAQPGQHSWRLSESFGRVPSENGTRPLVVRADGQPECAMRIRRFVTVLAAVACLAAAPGLAGQEKPAASHVDVAGTWTGEITTPASYSPIPLCVKFEETEGGLAGFAWPGERQVPIKNVKRDGNRLAFDISGPTVVYAFDVTVTQDLMEGSMSATDQGHTWSGKTRLAREKQKRADKQ